MRSGRLLLSRCDGNRARSDSRGKRPRKRLCPIAGRDRSTLSRRLEVYHNRKIHYRHRTCTTIMQINIHVSVCRRQSMTLYWQRKGHSGILRVLQTEFTITDNESAGRVIRHRHQVIMKKSAVDSVPNDVLYIGMRSRSPSRRGWYILLVAGAGSRSRRNVLLGAGVAKNRAALAPKRDIIVTKIFVDDILQRNKGNETSCQCSSSVTLKKKTLILNSLCNEYTDSQTQAHYVTNDLKNILDCQKHPFHMIWTSSLHQSR